MRVNRTITKTMKAENIQVGDSITFKLEGFGIFSATAQKIEDDRVLFMFDDCVAERTMNDVYDNEGGFEASDLKKWVDTELFEAFPLWMRKRMSGLSIPSYGLMFGHDDWYENFVPDEDEQLPLMKKRKNRVADFKDNYCWYWLSNAVKQQISSKGFAYVFYGGDANYDGAGFSGGVRPVFYLSKKHAAPCGRKD